MREIVRMSGKYDETARQDERGYSTPDEGDRMDRQQGKEGKMNQ